MFMAFQVVKREVLIDHGTYSSEIDLLKPEAMTLIA